jgi:hypothetical protein
VQSDALCKIMNSISSQTARVITEREDDGK